MVFILYVKIAEIKRIKKNRGEIMAATEEKEKYYCEKCNK